MERSQAKNAFNTEFSSDHFVDLKADPFKVKNVQNDGEIGEYEC